MLYVNPDHVLPIFGIVAIVGAVSIAARAVVIPLVKAFVGSGELAARSGADPARLDAQDRRIAELEGDLSAVKQELERLSAVESFYAQLQARGPGAGRDLPPAAS